MPAPSEPHGVGESTGRHGLGPHVVGHRVVVRRLLVGQTGPSGGPAMTDLLGTCVSWADGLAVLLVENRAGETRTETVPWADIVSGKPVPPRPSRWSRVSPREAQRHGLALFPDLETRPVGDWVLRHSPTATARRAHSVLAFGPSGVADDVAQVEAFYDRPVAAVLTGSAEQQRFRGLGWVAESGDADTWFQVAGTAALLRTIRSLTPSGSRREAERWEATGERWTRVTLSDGLATGYAGLDGDWVGLAGLHVDPAHRRRGLGLALVAALVEWGAEAGASTAYLQVLSDNAGALALYDRLGFVHHHAYGYLTPG